MTKEEAINELSKLSGQHITLFFYVANAFGTDLYSYASGVFSFDDAEDEYIRLFVGDAMFFANPNQIIRADTGIISISVSS